MRIWQANIGKTIIAHVPITDGQVQETGDFELDGVTFPAAEIVLEFIDPSEEGEGSGSMFPTGHLVDDLEVPGVGTFKATMITAGIPTVFVNAADIGYTGTELREAINGDPQQLARFEQIRVAGALRMGLIKDARGGAQAAAHAQDCVRRAATGLRRVERQENRGGRRRPARARLVDGQAAPRDDGHGGSGHWYGRGDSRDPRQSRGRRRSREAVRFGHPSGTLRVGAEATQLNGEWTVTRAIMSRSARVLMEGAVCVPADSF